MPPVGLGLCGKVSMLLPYVLREDTMLHLKANTGNPEPPRGLSSHPHMEHPQIIPISFSSVHLAHSQGLGCSPHEAMLELLAMV